MARKANWFMLAAEALIVSIYPNQTYEELAKTVITARMEIMSTIRELAKNGIPPTSVLIVPLEGVMNMEKKRELGMSDAGIEN